MRVLEQLEPQGVFRFFEELCAIPHGSRNCQAVSDWCVDFARERGLECHQDQAAAPVILQGHLDMVCEKEPGCTKDMAGEGLDLLVEDGCVRAKGTTLGGDDGIAVAMALAILDDQAIPHPRLEVVLTTDEEIGMLGAEALDAAPLRGRTLINVDSEEEGIFTVSCAGGSMAQCTLPVTRAPYDGAVLEVTVRGLTGGHSGTEIHKGRANACVLLGRLLQAIAEQTELRLVTAAGGGKDNAIAVEASAQVVVSDDAVARQAVEALAADLSREYAAADPGLRVEAAPCTVRETPMDWASTERAVCMLTCLPNGVQAMSMEIHGLVQTSLNLGILAADQTALTATFCVRSSLGSQKEMLHRRLRTLMAQLGGTVSSRAPAHCRRKSVVRGAVPWYNSRKAAGDGGNQGGNIMYHCFRLRRGQDLYEEIEAYVKAHHIAAGAVVSGVGCVSRWRLRDATGVRVRSGEEDVEIVSLMGTVSEYGCHLHASFSREDLSAFGGHLLPGCTVNTTAEIVLAEIRSCVFTRRPDSETGYEELESGPAYPEETRNDRREER